MAEQTTAYRASRQSSRRFTFTLSEADHHRLDQIRQHLGARSHAETVRRLIVWGEVRVRMNNNAELAFDPTPALTPDPATGPDGPLKPNAATHNPADKDGPSQ